MINLQILFFVAEIGTSKNKNLIFHAIHFKQGYLSNYVRYYYELFYDSSSYFILCNFEKYVLKIFKKLPVFLDKIRTKP